MRRSGSDWVAVGNSDVVFTPVSSDVLVATVTFADSAQLVERVTMGAARVTTIEGIQFGYLEGDLDVVPNVWFDSSEYHQVVCEEECKATFNHVAHDGGLIVAGLSFTPDVAAASRQARAVALAPPQV